MNFKYIKTAVMLGFITLILSVFVKTLHAPFIPTTQDLMYPFVFGCVGTYIIIKLFERNERYYYGNN